MMLIQKLQPLLVHRPGFCSLSRVWSFCLFVSFLAWKEEQGLCLAFASLSEWTNFSEHF